MWERIPDLPGSASGWRATGVGLVVESTSFAVIWAITYLRLFVPTARPYHGTDMELPVRGIYYLFSLHQPWHPLSLGSFRTPNNQDIVYGLIGALPGRSYLLSQFLLLFLTPLVGYAGMLVLLRRTFTVSRYPAIAAGVVFAFSPVYLAWFTLPYMLGYAFLPWYFVALFALLRAIANDETGANFLYFVSTFAIAASLTSSFYFQNATLVVFASVLAVPLVYAETRPNVNLQLLARTAVATVLVFGLYAVSFSRLAFILERVTSGGAPGGPLTSIQFVTSHYEAASVLNVMTFAGGSPHNLRFEMLQGRPLGLLYPILAFSGLLVVRSRRASKTTSHQYLYFTGLAIVTIAVSQLMVYLGTIGSEHVTTSLLAGFRRPERLLEGLSFFYAVLIGFSLDHFRAFFDGPWRPSPPVRLERRRIRSGRWLFRVLIALLLVVHGAYAGLAFPSSSAPVDQLVTPQPDSFDDLSRYLEERPDAAYRTSGRYAVYPLYSPLYSNLRYNYPSVLYADGYASDRAARHIETVNGMVAADDPAAVVPLALSSVDDVVVLPDDYSSEAHQSWRLRGDVRQSGSSMFGAPAAYRGQFTHVDEFTGRDGGELGIYENELAVPRIYIPRRVVTLNATDSRSYGMVYAVSRRDGDWDRFAVVTQSSLGAHEMTVRDHRVGERRHYQRTHLSEEGITSNVTSANSTVRAVLSFDSDVIVNGTGNDRLVQYSGSAEQAASIWLDISEVRANGTPLRNSASSTLRYRFSARNVNVSDLEFHLLTEEGDIVPAEFTVRSGETGETTNVGLTVRTERADFEYLRVRSRLTGESRLWFPEPVEVDIEKRSLTLDREDAECSRLSLYSTSTYDHYDVDCDSTTGVSAPSADEESALLTWEQRSAPRWQVIERDVEWRSPSNVRFRAVIRAPDSTGLIRVPVVFGNSYDGRWTLSAAAAGAEVANVTHEPVNGYANGWFVELRQPSGNEIQFVADITVGQQYHALYRLRTVAAGLIILVALGSGLVKYRS